MEGWAVWLEVPPGGTAVPTSFPLSQTLPVASVPGKGVPGQSLSSPAPGVHTRGTGVHAHAHTEPSSCCILFQDKKSGDPRGGCQSPCSRGIQTH